MNVELTVFVPTSVRPVLAERRKKKVAPATTKAATPTAAAASTSARPAVPSQIPELPIKLDAEVSRPVRAHSPP